jgi:hypothetical protein
MTVLDDLLARIKGLPEEARAELEKEVMTATSSMIWVPNPGPQTEAFKSLADIVLYGGAGGGGKSDLGLGLAFSSHQRSLVMRRKYSDLSGLTDRAIQINGTRKGFNGSPPPKLITVDGRLIEFGAAQYVGDEESWQGRPHDLLYIDEAAHFAKQQILFLLGWVRSTTPGQRTRVVLGSNPPLAEEGLWMFEMFAPWLDPQHSNPAKPGELRWFVTGKDGRDIEVDGPGEHLIDGETVSALSRTFIPAKLADNPYLANTNYKATQDALPPHLREAVRDGNFGAVRKDHELQLIPTAWIEAAMARWTPEPPEGVPMCSIGTDVAQGGEDNTVLAPRYDSWFAELIEAPGTETPFGKDVAGLVIKNRRDDALVIVDMGGGYGGSTYEHLKANNIPVAMYKGAEKTKARTKNGALKFFNKRAETYYRFYEALDPSQLGGSSIALPNHPKLKSDLCAIRLEDGDITTIKLEPKKDMVKRLGRSTDYGDAVVVAYSGGAKIASHYHEWKNRGTPRVVMGHTATRRR